MRRLSVLVLLTLAAPLRAELRIEPPTADLGELRGGPVHEQRFELANTGTTPIEIIGVRRDCGCLEPALEKRTLAPGEHAALGFRIRTLGQPEGPRTWQAWVQYRDGGELKEIRLALRATVRNEVTVQPPALALYLEKSLQQEIIVTDRRTPGLHLTAAYASTPAVKATLLPQGDGVTRVVLDVSAADLGVGRHEATLALYTDDPYYREFQIPITLERAGKPAATATPSVVRVRPSATQPLSSHLVRLRPVAGRRALIDTATPSDPGLACTWAAGPDDAATLKVQVDTRRVRPGGHSVQVQLMEPARAVLNIPVIVEE